MAHPLDRPHWQTPLPRLLRLRRSRASASSPPECRRRGTAGDPRRAPEDRTFDELATYYEAYRLPTKRSAKGDRSILNAHLRPELGGLLLRQICAKRIDAYASTRTHLAPRTVRNHLALLRTMLRKAAAIGWLDTVPEIAMPRVEPDEDEEPPRLTADGVGKLLKPPEPSSSRRTLTLGSPTCSTRRPCTPGSVLASSQDSTCDIRNQVGRFSLG